MASGVCVLSVCVCVCVAFNLDTSFPLLKTGRRRTLFGLSVALHQDLRTDSLLLLVGAPREKAEPGVPANQTGGVYSCPVSTDQSECSRMKLIDPEVNLSEDLIEDMWLGVTVASQAPPGGRVLVCGHRFVKLYGPLGIRQMIGRCYLRGNDLWYNDTDMNWQNPEQPCSHLGDVRAEVMCNAGISASITQNEVIIGSPGSYEWQGNVHVSWLNPDDVFDSQKSSFTNMNHRSIYIGYSVTQSHHLLSGNDVTIVTGAPKDSKHDARGSVLLAVKRSNQLIGQLTLRGEQTGSYFGNAVATSDFNNDGWDDLLVGAPFYFHRQREVGGAVYVYMNSGGRISPEPSVVLRGPAGSAFGMSVTAAGDLNQDGFQDFAVGAPFHETGSVMIWVGSKDGVTTEPSQVIRGSSVSPRFRTFGFSLSSGLDVDGNKYPDLLIGSLDDTVALLRTRPVIHLSKTLRVFPNIVDSNVCDFCIQVEVCFSYIFSTGEKSDRDNITVSFTVAADITSLKPRLHFHDNGHSTYSTFLSMSKKLCQTIRVGLLSPVRDKVEPLVFSLDASLHENLPKRRSPLHNLKHFPVLSHTPHPIRTQIQIQKTCGSENHCHSNLQMTAQFTDEDQKPFSRVNVSQLLQNNITVTRLLLEVNISNLQSPGRPAEDAQAATLNISFPPSLLYSGVRTKGEMMTSSVKCSVKHLVLVCELGNPFRSQQKVQVWIIFQFDMTVDTTEIQAELQLSTLSEQSLSPVLVSLLVNHWLLTSLSLISSPGPASFSGHVMGENLGALLLFIFQVHVQGPSLGRLGNLAVEFHWPGALSNGKRLLYLTEVQVQGARCDPPDTVTMLLEEGKDRGRRNLEEEHVLHLYAHRKKSYILDCVQGAKCVTFVCPLTDMKNSATLTVRARLWSTTMMEDFTDAESVVVRGRATLKLHTNTTNIKMEPHSVDIEVHIYPELGQQVDFSAPWWLLVVSVMVGVSLLAVICLLLWKCGFFVRHTVALHQGRIMGKQQQHKDADGFLIQGHAPSPPKHWLTSWTETR
ncbi:integrin alpha-3-like isoform X3 [Solea solea]|uniref:integrin alpha-3-like isoform X3 n=1 Tax=Solea solea TaxID=90069 RepID=UPI00272C9C3C|nr:integrin alpha-3-like isoform X3 [Solea solea]